MRFEIRAGLAMMFVFLSFSIPLAGNLETQTNNVLSLGWDSWAPYQYKDGDGVVTGLDIDLVKAIAGNCGYHLKMVQMPWKRNLLHVKKGVTDLALGATKTAEREEYAYFSDPVRQESVVLYVRKGGSSKYPFIQLSDMIGTSFRLGAAAEFYYGERYETLKKNPEFKSLVQEVPQDLPNVKKIMKNRIDGFLIDPFAGAALIKELGYQNKLEIHPMTVYSDNVHIMFSKKTVSLKIVEEFNKGLKTLRENGTYEHIVNCYLK